MNSARIVRKKISENVITSRTWGDSICQMVKHIIMLSYRTDNATEHPDIDASVHGNLL